MRIPSIIRQDGEYKASIAALAEQLSAKTPLPIVINGLSGGSADAYLVEAVGEARLASRAPVVVFVGNDADLDTACKHFNHFAEMDPSCRHIALGGDLDGCDILPKGFEGVQDYPKLAEKLLKHGFTEQMIRDIFWNNALTVMRNCCG